MAINTELNGINNDLLDKLIVDVSTYADDLSLILNTIDETFLSSLSDINCDITHNLKESYDGISNNFKQMKLNILSYGTDYARVKEAYLSRGVSVVKQVNSIETKKIVNYEEENYGKYGQ